MTKARSASLLALAGFGLATAGAAWYGARYSRNGNRDIWYQRLEKPRFTPPDQAFPVVWTTLYALIAWSGWRVWSAAPSRERDLALRLWLSQLAANARWSKLFFGQHRPTSALADVVALEGSQGRSRGGECVHSLCRMGGLRDGSECRNRPLESTGGLNSLAHDIHRSIMMK